MRELLVHLDASSACAVRLHLARRLAEDHGAHLTALFAVVPGSSALQTSFSAGAVAGTMEHLDIDGRQRAHAALDRIVSRGGPPVDWAESVAEPPLHALARHALFADLMVLGKRNPDGPDADQLPAGFVESVVMASGKPALVVPDDTTVTDLGRRVLVAWKPSRESTRALAAALPVLRRASSVKVVMWREPNDTEAPEARLALLGAYLRRHGVQAQVDFLGAAPRHLGEAILGQARQNEADLLVMGCYGHSRAREFLLGGASRSVLRVTSLPVLLAH